MRSRYFESCLFSVVASYVVSTNLRVILSSIYKNRAKLWHDYFLEFGTIYLEHDTIILEFGTII